MAIYYVDPATGSDSNSGTTPGSPWLTMQHAIDNANGGDTINLANTAAYTHNDRITWNTGFGTTQSTDADNPLIVQAWDNGGSLIIDHPADGYTCGVIDGNSTAASAFHNSGDPAYLILKNIKFTNHTTSDPLSSTLLGGCLLVGCEFENNNGGTTKALCQTGNETLMVDCWIHNAGGNGVRGSTRLWMMNCLIQDCGEDGFSGNGTDDLLIQGCIFEDVDGHGIYLNNVENFLIRNNTIIGKNAAGKWAIEISSGGNFNGKILNNVFVDWNGSGGGGIQGGLATTQQLIGHNFYHACATDKSNVNAHIDLGNDVSGTSNPFSSDANQDWSVDDQCKAAGFPPGFLGSNEGAATGTKTFIDLGAVQREEPVSGGGGNKVLGAMQGVM